MPKYDSHELKLANEIANALDDRDSLALFLTFTKKYNEQFLRRTLANVMAMHEDRIRKSRGALFTYVVNQHAPNFDSRP